jgi:EAL domain-containing protein (putative c-di-GMP-specific phosphodiesterase class I)
MQAAARPRDRGSIAPFAFCWADILLSIDPDGQIVFAAGASEPVLGQKPDSLLGLSLVSLVAPADRALLSQALRQGRKEGRTPERVVRVMRGRNMVPVKLAGYCLGLDRGDMHLGLRAATDLDKPDAPPAATMIEQDRKLFAETAAANVKIAQASGIESPEVSLISLSGLESLKAKLSEAGRQELDDSVTSLLRRTSFGGETVTKLGAEKFGLVHASDSILPETLEALEELTRSFDPAGKGAKAEGATVGTSTDGITEEDLARGLLAAMNTFQNSSAGALNMQTLVANFDNLMADATNQLGVLRNALAKGQFKVALQSILNAQTGELHHYEALCRFDAIPKTSPAGLITFAEQTGLITEFDLAMAKKVIEWLGQFPRNSDRRHVAVNVSGSSVMSQQYIDGLRALLAANPWTQGKLMFEITESSRMADLEAANHFIGELRAMGYKVCLDDFGAGSASFQYLSALDVDVVKIDGSAVKNAMVSRKGRGFLSALTELCRRMNVQTVAEMIDDVANLRFVRDCGCEYVQGYLFGKPATDYRELPKADPSMFRAAR